MARPSRCLWGTSLPFWRFVCVTEPPHAPPTSQDGKATWHGKAKQVSGPGALPPAKAAYLKRKQMIQSRGGGGKRGKKGQDSDEEDDEDEDATTRFELNSLLAEVEQELDPEHFRRVWKGRGGLVALWGYQVQEMCRNALMCEQLDTGEHFRCVGRTHLQIHMRFLQSMCMLHSTLDGPCCDGRGGAGAERFLNLAGAG